MGKDDSKVKGQTPANLLQEIVLSSAAGLFPDESCSDRALLLESYRRLQMLYAVGRTICGEIRPGDVLRAALEAVVRLTGAERCFVITVDAEGALAPAAGHPSQFPADSQDWPISKSVVRRVLAEGMSLLSSDAPQDFPSVSSVRAHGIRSILCVPLGTPDSLIGVVYADNRVEQGTFSELDLRFLTALSHYIFAAIRNAREIQQATARQKLSDERCRILQEELLEDHQIVGSSQVMLRTYERLRQVAPKEGPILLQGESGTGKELFAKAAHRLSPREGKAFLPVNVAAFSEDLVESELFGHVKGAFTSALRDKRGRFELASGGTLFLDEVAEIPRRIQAKLLRVLEDGEFERVGGEETIRTDIRLICATNVDLAKAVDQGQFRQDLYFRLAGVTIQLPPLRQRLEDVPQLVDYILKKIRSRKRFDEPAICRLQAYHWPGNVRQLIRAVEEMNAVCPSDVITAEDLPPHFAKQSAGPAPEFQLLKERVAEVEHEHIRRALVLSGGNNERAIRMLGVSREQFFRKKKLYGLGAASLAENGN